MYQYSVITGTCTKRYTERTDPYIPESMTSGSISTCGVMHGLLPVVPGHHFNTKTRDPALVATPDGCIYRTSVKLEMHGEFAGCYRSPYFERRTIPSRRHIFRPQISQEIDEMTMRTLRLAEALVLHRL